VLLHLWLCFFSITAFVKYGARFASDFDLADSFVLEEHKLILLLRGTGALPH
jgi:hypothetical protein